MAPTSFKADGSILISRYTEAKDSIEAGFLRRHSCWKLTLNGAATNLKEPI